MLLFAAALRLAGGGSSLAATLGEPQAGAGGVQLAARLGGGDDAPWAPYASPKPPPAEPTPETESVPGTEAVPGTETTAPVAPVDALREGTDSGLGIPAPDESVRVDDLEMLEPERIKVALLVPLTGRSAGVGQAILNAAQLALFDAARGDFALLPRDTAGTPEGAEAAARSAIEDGAALILGPLYADSVRRVAPLVQAAGVNVIAFSTDSTVAGEGVFVMGFLPRTQIQRVVAFARSRGLLRFAALAPDTPYGTTVVRELQKATRSNAAMLTRIEFYDAGGDDAAEVVKRLAPKRAKKNQPLDLGFDAVVLPDGGERLLAVAPLLAYYDIDPGKVRFIGTGLWDDPLLGREPALVGGWYAAPSPDFRAAFVERYRQVYGGVPPRLATLGYDSTALAAVLAQGPDGPEFDAEALTAPNGFTGLDGIFRFRPDGLVERGLAVLEVHRDRPRVVLPAPESFATFTN